MIQASRQREPAGKGEISYVEAACTHLIERAVQSLGRPEQTAGISLSQLGTCGLRSWLRCTETSAPFHRRCQRAAGIRLGRIDRVRSQHSLSVSSLPFCSLCLSLTLSSSLSFSLPPSLTHSLGHPLLQSLDQSSSSIPPFLSLCYSLARIASRSDLQAACTAKCCWKNKAGSGCR
jgi:hypothetical protein